MVIPPLTLAAAVVGLLPTSRPTWSPSSSWMVTHVPGSVWLLVLGSTAVCIAAAIVLTVRTAGLHTRAPLTWAWVGLLGVSAAALVWSAIYAAALSTIDFGAVIPIFDWLFSFAPAVLAGWLFAQRSRHARYAAALGTGVVTVPLLALSFALLDSPGLSLAGVLGALFMVAVLGVAPLAGGVAVAGAISRPRQLPAATS